ncbi:hypothetical protein [Stutzerimonas nitrititolerans]|uniref:hypothetical protein n=1 Tax=Stutzerimonas nitrititolerans TaxID=2482751 RepID=UPI0028AAE61D|nr:hypothetical protein [Stutzerimonas nitrititolerans]
MTEPTASQVAALALPGETWEAARQRVRRLLGAVKQCVQCLHCGPEDMAHYRLARGWVDETSFSVDMCPRCYGDTYDPSDLFGDD